MEKCGKYTKIVVVLELICDVLCKDCVFQGIINPQCTNITINDDVNDWRYAAPGEFPWVVSLQHDLPIAVRHFCGGSLATGSLVLTACHCLVTHSLVSNTFEMSDPENKVVVAGSISNNRSDERFEHVVVEIKKFTVHPKCHHFHLETNDDFGGWDYDFGWVYLKKQVNFNGVSLAPFSLFSLDKQATKANLMRMMAENKRCIVVGWGKRKVSRNRTKIYEDSSSSHTFWSELTVIEVTLTNFAYCFNILCRFSSVYCNVDHWSRSQVCATSYGTLEVCHGDSGGPLMCGDRNHLYGVVGWGPSCGRYRIPSMYPTVYGGWDFVFTMLAHRKDHLRSVKSRELSLICNFVLSTMLALAAITAC